MKDCGIRYAFTNVKSDSYTYPILHEKKTIPKRPQKLENQMNGNTETEERIVCSQHLEVSNALFTDIRRQNSTKKEDEPVGNVLFICVAGQNRSAALGVATLLLHGKPMEEILKHCARQRPFVLENIGFQRQLVELEAIISCFYSRTPSRTPTTTENNELLRNQYKSHWEQIQSARLETQQEANKRVRITEVNEDDRKLQHLTSRPLSTIHHSKSERDILQGKKVEIELLIPGLCTMEVRIPKVCTINTVKQTLIQHANENLLRHDKLPAKIAKAWLILAMFGKDDMYDIPLESEAVELRVQLERMKSMFDLNAKLKGMWLFVIVCIYACAFSISS